jgi:hypothetical protein
MPNIGKNEKYFFYDTEKQVVIYDPELKNEKMKKLRKPKNKQYENAIYGTINSNEFIYEEINNNKDSQQIDNNENIRYSNEPNKPIDLDINSMYSERLVIETPTNISPTGVYSRFDNIPLVTSESGHKLSPRSYKKEIKSEFTEHEISITSIKFAEWVAKNNWQLHSKKEQVYWNNPISYRDQKDQLRTIRELFNMFIDNIENNF